jgi:hypothetical protein
MMINDGYDDVNFDVNLDDDFSSVVRRDCKDEN